ncbi:MAG: translation elongation factor EF-1 subunit alpha [Candidatus Micrarchaeota archaeon]|nr:translation elongation factor EF-1 subunit alpha [Candidatus Micrarchaeota archaeon]
MPKKEHINIVFVGHVDAGKSTTVGRILYETGRVPEQMIAKLKEEAQRLGKATFEFAYVMDRMKEERERGVTIDISHQDFETNKYFFTIIDAPGHKDFVKNMITGASQADGAVLVVSAKDGIQPQTIEHAALLKVLGISQLIVLISKMDAVNYDKATYEKVKGDVQNLLKKFAYKNVEQIPVIPASSYFGDNLVKKSDKMSWYSGPTLFEALDTFTPPKKPTDRPLRMPIQDVYNIQGFGVVVVGKVESGIMKPGMKAVINPGGYVVEVKKIETHHQEIPEAVPGDNIGVNVKGVEKTQVKRGFVLGDANNPPAVVKSFKAQIAVLNHPSAIGVGYTPVFHAHTTHFPAKIVEIVAKLDPKTGQPVNEKVEFLKNGDVAIVKIEPLKPVVIEKASDYPALGRFAIRDMNQTVAAGIVIDIERAQ